MSNFYFTGFLTLSLKMSCKCHDIEVMSLKANSQLSRIMVGPDNWVNRKDWWSRCKLQRHPSGSERSQLGSSRTH